MPKKPSGRRVRNRLGKGIRMERKSCEYLRNQAYRTARSSASLGPFDVIAFSPFVCLLVQVKCNRMPPRAELREFENFPAPASTTFKQVHIWRKGAKTPEVRRLVKGGWL